ncbi:hypothetical protein PTNB85_06744 [Pyrenophora teres f. teres]|nr:hypothetical protein PTNB85_06744 [Pyrenophora teres f. teres]
MAYLLLPSDTTAKTNQETHVPQTRIPIRFAETTSDHMAYNYDSIERSNETKRSKGSGSITYADADERYEVEAAVPAPLVWKKEHSRTPAAEAIPSRPTESHIRHSRSHDSSFRGAQAQQHRSGGGGGVVASSSSGRNIRQPRPLPQPPTPRPYHKQIPQAPAINPKLTPQSLTIHNTKYPPTPRLQPHPSHPATTHDYEPPPYAPLCSPLTHNCDKLDHTIYTPFTADSAVNLHPDTLRRASDTAAAATHQKRISLAPMEAQYLRSDVKGYREYSATWDRVKHVGRVVAEVIWKDR